MNIPDNKLGFLIKMIHVSFETKINMVLSKYDLTRSQCDIIIYLIRSEGLVTQRMIEKALHVSNPTVTGLLNRLEAKGFLERKVSEKDARFKYIVLTEKARKVDKEILSKLEENERELFSFLTDEECEELRILLRKIDINL